jgi:AcrB/AcrD/AcrF family
MTSLAFILGVAPLVVATGAGAEMRQSLGTAVFGGMLGVTGFGLIFTPAFYTLVQWIGARRSKAPSPAPAPRSTVMPVTILRRKRKLVSTRWYSPNR